MLYRKMPKSGDELSILGFGCMRFPLNADGSIDEIRSTKMVRSAIDDGLNYIDTAYPYHKGESEPVVGRMLQDGYREKVKLATKLPCWLIKSREDMDKYLNEQLQRLQTDHIDYYLIHALNKTYWKNVTENGLFDFIDKALADGRIKHIGFSFHDELPLFKEIVDAYDWTFCQIQYNYLDTEYQAGREGLEYAAAKGLGIIVMEPLRGGKLTANVPDDIMQIWNEADRQRPPVEWALRWIWNHPQVNLLLSGMSVPEQVAENLKIASEALPESLTEKELHLIERVGEEYRKRIRVNCTKCMYCMPCPAGVNIPGCLGFLNNAYMFNNVEQARKEYINFIGDAAKADKCVSCGKCEEACPQHISIIEGLVECKVLFGVDK